MLKRLKRPREIDNQIWLGLVSVLVIAVVIGTIVGIGRLSLGYNDYRGEFAQAAQLKPGDQVTLAGIEVGKVTDIGLAGGHVVVDFDVRNDIVLGAQTRAAIKLTTLLGRRYLELSPGGSGGLEHRTIALAHTSVPYNLQDTLADATATFEKVDADRIATSMSELSKGLAGVPEALPQALQNVESLAGVIASRRGQIGSLLRNVDSITGMIHDQQTDLGVLVVQGRELLQTATSRQEAINRLFGNTTALVNALQTVVGDVPEIDAMLADLREFTAIMRKRDATVRSTLQVMPVAFRNLANASGSGTALDINLPAGIMVDSWMCALSARGEQFSLAQYFTDCSPTADPFPGWPAPDPARAPR